MITTPFHLVSPSPWPILASMQLFNMLYTTTKTFNSNPNPSLFFINLILMMVIAWNWWRDIVRESTFESRHTKEVISGMKVGMMLFITSEVFFFLSFFWAFFHASLSPDIFIGEKWPCEGIKALNPMAVPLMNTLILLSSGVTLTVSHHLLILGNKSKSNLYLSVTVLLGIYFTTIQLLEYMETTFSIADSVFGSTFFMATGFHGLHVIIGTIFLMATLGRLISNQVSSYHHFGFEAAAWYWHFVDVVWLFLYICIYWWGK